MTSSLLLKAIFMSLMTCHLSAPRHTGLHSNDALMLVMGGVRKRSFLVITPMHLGDKEGFRELTERCSFNQHFKHLSSQIFESEAKRWQHMYRYTAYSCSLSEYRFDNRSRQYLANQWHQPLNHLASTFKAHISFIPLLVMCLILQRCMSLVMAGARAMGVL